MPGSIVFIYWTYRPTSSFINVFLSKLSCGYSLLLFERTHTKEFLLNLVPYFDGCF
jgi:hypothetical protein